MDDGWKVRMNICTALWSFVNFCCLSQSEVSTDNRKVSTIFAFQHVRCRCCYRSYLDRFLKRYSIFIHLFIFYRNKDQMVRKLVHKYMYFLTWAHDKLQGNHYVFSRHLRFWINDQLKSMSGTPLLNIQCYWFLPFRAANNKQSDYCCTFKSC